MNTQPETICASRRDVLPCILTEHHAAPLHEDEKGYTWPTATAERENAVLIEHARTIGMVEPEKAPAFVAAYRAHVEQRSAAVGEETLPQLDEITAEDAAAFVAAEPCTDPSHTGPIRAQLGCTGPDPAEQPDYGPVPEAWPAWSALRSTLTRSVASDEADRLITDYYRATVRRAQVAAAEPFAPRTKRAYWQAIADALNAAEAAGMPVGIDLDGTLTDHRAWSVVWDRDAKRWTLAGYDDEPEGTKEADDEGQEQPPVIAPAADEPPFLDPFTEAAVRRGALLGGADAIEALPQDYECDPGRGDAVKLLRRLAGLTATTEQPAGLTWEARAEHAVRLYATTAIELEDARRENGRLRDRLAELEQGQADADHLDAEHPDTIAALVDEIADDIPHRRAPQIAATYLNRHARLLASQIAALGQARGWSTWAAEFIHPDREFVDPAKDDHQAAAGQRDNLDFNRGDTVAAVRDALLDPNEHTPETALAAARVLLAAHTRLLADEAHEHTSQRGKEMHAEGYRGRVAWCSGMREVAMLLGARADALAPQAGR
ncbi:hypothetical protein [Streptomyces sp. NPDC026589]|uniref:hypothetical protein n=1 Tax=Streptomyces sp. NPDC026589 TaxID=3155609 RepID=UPI003407A037